MAPTTRRRERVDVHVEHHVTGVAARDQQAFGPTEIASHGELEAGLPTRWTTGVGHSVPQIGDASRIEHGRLLVARLPGGREVGIASDVPEPIVVERSNNGA